MASQTKNTGVITTYTFQPDGKNQERTVLVTQEAVDLAEQFLGYGHPTNKWSDDLNERKAIERARNQAFVDELSPHILNLAEVKKFMGEGYKLDDGARKEYSKMTSGPSEEAGNPVDKTAAQVRQQAK